MTGLLRAAALAVVLGDLSGCTPERPRHEPRPLDVILKGGPATRVTFRDIEKLGQERIKVADPHEHRTLEMRGVPARAAFDAWYGPTWRAEEDVVITCQDGFQPTIPVSLFVERAGYLAYARVDSADFDVEEEPDKRTPVGPYYLVWKEDPEKPPPPEPDWPYQATGIEVTNATSRLAATLPPPGADGLTTRGFERFRTFCLPCHTVNGRGGTLGPELNYPVNVTEYFDEALLRQWIKKPDSVRSHAKMPPPFGSSDEDTAAAVDEVVAYLRAMKKRKIAPPGVRDPASP